MKDFSRFIPFNALVVLLLWAGSTAAQRPKTPTDPPDEKQVEALLVKLTTADPKDDELRKLTKALLKETTKERELLQGRLGNIPSESFGYQLAELLSVQRRMIETGLLLCEKPEEKRLLLNQMVAHTKMNAKRIRSMTEAGLRAPYLSGLAESTYLEARILLLRFELPAEPVVPPRPGVPTDKAVRELQIERVKNLAIVLSQQSERLGRTFEDYDSQLANLLATQRRVMEARIELSDTAEDKFLQLKRLIEAAKAMEANIDLRSNAGVGAPSRVNRARSHRLEAEIELLRFQTGRELTPMRDPNPKPAGGIDPATIEPIKLIAQLLRDGRKNDNVAELLKALFRELMVVRRQTDTRLGAEKEDFYSQLIEITGTTERLLRTGLELCESAEQAIALRMHVLNMAIDIETRVKRRTDAGIGDSYAYNLARSFRLDQEIRLLQAKAELDQGSNLNAVVPCQATPCPCVAPIASPKVGPIRRLVARFRSP